MIDTNVKYTDKDLFQFKFSGMTVGEFREIKEKEKKFLSDPLLPIAVLDICSQATGSDILKTISRNREPNAVFARFLTMYFMQIFRSDLTLGQLGEMAGGRSHADVIHGIREVEKVADPTYPSDLRRPWYNTALLKLEHRYKNHDLRKDIRTV